MENVCFQLVIQGVYTKYLSLFYAIANKGKGCTSGILILLKSTKQKAGEQSLHFT